MDAVFEAGAEFGIKPIGLGARDTLRLEMEMTWMIPRRLLKLDWDGLPSL